MHWRGGGGGGGWGGGGGGGGTDDIQLIERETKASEDRSLVPSRKCIGNGQDPNPLFDYITKTDVDVIAILSLASFVGLFPVSNFPPSTSVLWVGAWKQAAAYTTNMHSFTQQDSQPLNSFPTVDFGCQYYSL